jgi:hypothetical protein
LSLSFQQPFRDQGRKKDAKGQISVTDEVEINSEGWAWLESCRRSSVMILFNGKTFIFEKILSEMELDKGTFKAIETGKLQKESNHFTRPLFF